VVRGLGNMDEVMGSILCSICKPKKKEPKFWKKIKKA
jgi:hypothetical protein